MAVCKTRLGNTPRLEHLEDYKPYKKHQSNHCSPKNAGMHHRFLIMIAIILCFVVYAECFARCTQTIAFVVPFVERDIDELAHNAKEEWRRYPPFLERDTFLRKCVDLIFYYSLTPGKLDPTKMQDLLEANDFDRTGFLSVSSMFANLSETEDSERVSGANAMFKRLFCDTDVYSHLAQKYSHIFIMERDVHPIRQGWAAFALRMSMIDSEFWIKGSAYYGSDHFLDTWQKFHLNGNALYSLSPQFRSECICGHPFAMPYDVNLYFRCYEFSANHSLTQPYIHRFQYTTFIVNTYTDATTDSATRDRFPGAFLVHNKNFKYA